MNTINCIQSVPINYPIIIMHLLLKSKNMETNISLVKHDWTHKEVKMIDVRKLSEYYIFMIEPEFPNVVGQNREGYYTPLLVKDKIFDERLKTYFLKDAHRVTREEILGVKWNLFITQGYYDLRSMCLIGSGNKYLSLCNRKEAVNLKNFIVSEFGEKYKKIN